MTGRIKQAEVFEAPCISVKAKVVAPGTINGKSNIQYKEEYVVAPSGKKIATYIRNQLFGSELITETEDLNINWLMPTLSEALEKAIYQTESFIYLHKYDNKVSKIVFSLDGTVPGRSQVPAGPYACQGSDRPPFAPSRRRSDRAFPAYQGSGRNRR